MMTILKDIVIQHYPMILICACMFLSGVGIGAAITDAMNRKGGRDEIQDTARE